MFDQNPNNREGDFTIHIVHIGSNADEKERIDHMTNKEKNNHDSNFPSQAFKDFAKFMNEEFGDSRFVDVLNSLENSKPVNDKEESKGKKDGNSINPDSITNKNRRMGDTTSRSNSEAKQEETKESDDYDRDEMTYSEEALSAIHDVLANISYQLDQIIKRIDKDSCPIQPGMFDYIGTEELQADNINIDKYIKRRVKKEFKKQLNNYLQDKKLPKDDSNDDVQKKPIRFGTCETELKPASGSVEILQAYLKSLGFIMDNIDDEDEDKK